MNVKKIEQYRTPIHPVLTAEVRRKFTSIRHIWTTGDTLWKLATKLNRREFVEALEKRFIFDRSRDKTWLKEDFTKEKFDWIF